MSVRVAEHDLRKDPVLFSTRARSVSADQWSIVWNVETVTKLCLTEKTHISILVELRSHSHGLNAALLDSVVLSVDQLNWKINPEDLRSAMVPFRVTFPQGGHLFVHLFKEVSASGPDNTFGHSQRQNKGTKDIPCSLKLFDKCVDLRGSFHQPEQRI